MLVKEHPQFIRETSEVNQSQLLHKEHHTDSNSIRNITQTTDEPRTNFSKQNRSWVSLLHHYLVKQSDSRLDTAVIGS